MTKKLYFCKTNAYNLLVSVDSDNNCRYLIETEEFPCIIYMDDAEREAAILKFLNTIEDDSAWEDDCEYNQIFVDGVEIIAVIEKEI